MHNIYGQSEFQSTHPARGATPYWCVLARPAFHFNPRTPRGVRQVADGPPGDCVIISIHAPREGCDKAPLAGGTKERNFNPRTPRGVRRDGMSAPMRGGDFNPRTPRGVRRSVMRSSICSNSISIHAPREGCDICSQRARAPSWNFNPRTPRGVRRSGCGTSQCPPRFQSTHPARGATTGMPWRSSMERFQSTHPARGATEAVRAEPPPLPLFQSTHPARGATLGDLWLVRAPDYFNPRTPRGVRP